MLSWSRTTSTCSPIASGPSTAPICAPMTSPVTDVSSSPSGRRASIPGAETGTTGGNGPSIAPPVKHARVPAAEVLPADERWQASMPVSVALPAPLVSPPDRPGHGHVIPVPEMGPSVRAPPGARSCTQVRDSDHGGCDDQQVDTDSRMPTHPAPLDRECTPRHSDHTKAASTACVTAHTLAAAGAHPTKNKRGGDDRHAVLDVRVPEDPTHGHGISRSSDDLVRVHRRSVLRPVNPLRDAPPEAIHPQGIEPEEASMLKPRAVLGQRCGGGVDHGLDAFRTIGREHLARIVDSTRLN